MQIIVQVLAAHMCEQRDSGVRIRSEAKRDRLKATAVSPASKVQALFAQTVFVPLLKLSTKPQLIHGFSTLPRSNNVPPALLASEFARLFSVVESSRRKAVKTTTPA